MDTNEIIDDCGSKIPTYSTIGKPVRITGRIYSCLVKVLVRLDYYFFANGWALLLHEL